MGDGNGAQTSLGPPPLFVLQKGDDTYAHAHQYILL